MLFGQENELLIHAIVWTKFENSMKHRMKEASHKKKHTVDSPLYDFLSERMRSGLCELPCHSTTRMVKCARLFWGTSIVLPRQFVSFFRKTLPSSHGIMQSDWGGEVVQVTECLKDLGWNRELRNRMGGIKRFITPPINLRALCPSTLLLYLQSLH